LAVDYNASLWCIAKHILSARVNLGETLEKLSRDCNERLCNISRTTALSAEEAVAQLIEVERHAMEVCGKCGPDAELAKSMTSLADTARRIRQEIAKSMLPVRVEHNELPPDVVDVIRKAYLEVDKLKDDIDRYATSMKQEQMSEECERCVVDFSGGVSDGS